MITPNALPKSSIVRCEIAISDAPVKIGTLGQVRWTERQKLDPQEYLSGVSLLL